MTAMDVADDLAEQDEADRRDETRALLCPHRVRVDAEDCDYCEVEEDFLQRRREDR